MPDDKYRQDADETTTTYLPLPARLVRSIRSCCPNRRYIASMHADKCIQKLRWDERNRSLLSLRSHQHALFYIFVNIKFVYFKTKEVKKRHMFGAYIHTLHSQLQFLSNRLHVLAESVRARVPPRSAYGDNFYTAKRHTYCAVYYHHYYQRRYGACPCMCLHLSLTVLHTLLSAAFLYAFRSVTCHLAACVVQQTVEYASCLRPCLGARQLRALILCYSGSGLNLLDGYYDNTVILLLIECSRSACTYVSCSLSLRNNPSTTWAPTKCSGGNCAPGSRLLPFGGVPFVGFLARIN